MSNRTPPSPAQVGFEVRASASPELVETTFFVPRLNQASVVGGACCPVPAEALIVPELEALAGVEEARADWRAAEVWVCHKPSVSRDQLADVLAELGYPVESVKGNTAQRNGVTSFD